MINSISIRNFGSNKKVFIKLDRYVTCITGESYTGKSWILRALRWIALNQPAGTNHIKWGTKKSTVTVRIGKHKIKKERSKSINAYYVDDRKMEAFGSKVPDSVSKLFNLTNINFQKQQEMPHGEGPLFWFALTPGQVSKRLNQIVNLDLIDRTLSNLQSEARSAKSILSVCKDRRKEAKQQAAELSFVEELKQEWGVICSLDEKTTKYETQVEQLKNLINEITKQQAVVDKLQSSNETQEQELQTLESLHDTIINIEEQIEDLSVALDNIKEAKQNLITNKKNLKTAELNYKKAFGKRCPLCLKIT